MKFRFQIGSNRPLAKRKRQDVLRRFLAQEVAMRKICFRRRLQCSLAFNDTALARSVPKGFSMMNAAVLDETGFGQQPHRRRAALGGTLK